MKDLFICVIEICLVIAGGVFVLLASDTPKHDKTPSKMATNIATAKSSTQDSTQEYAVEVYHYGRLVWKARCSAQELDSVIKRKEPYKEMFDGTLIQYDAQHKTLTTALLPVCNEQG